jgi:hypothetical protein
MLAERIIVTGQHCYGCTAGSGSGCQGAIAPPTNVRVDAGCSAGLQ